MSSYYSDSEIYQNEEEKVNELFRFDTSLISSIDTINIWKQNLGLSPVQYLKKEVEAVSNDYDLFSCGNQLRAISFCHMLHKSFAELITKYVNTYAKVADQKFDIVKEIAELDRQLATLVRYLQLIEANNTVIVLFSEIQQDFEMEIYQNLRKAADYCFDISTLWLTLLTPKMFRQELKQNLYKVNYGGTPLYYQKQLSYLHERIKRAQIKDYKLHAKSPQEVIKNIALIVNNDKLKPNLKTKIISLLKGQFYANKENKTLKQQFMISSMQMYNGEEVSEIWDYQRYENLCIQTLKKSFTDQQYLDCILYMEPQNISFERRKRTLEFAEIYYALINKILHNNQKKQMQQQQKPKIHSSINIPTKFIQSIMQSQNTQLICFLFVNFLISNKNAFSLNSPQLDRLLFGILEGLKQIYLSFGTGTWYLPLCGLAAMTNRFFCKFSEDIKDQIVNILPMMVKHLGDDKLPTKPHFTTFIQNEKQYTKCQLKTVSRSELLGAIFYYIKDAEYKDQDFYLDLGQVNPTNFQTAIMFIKSLQLKLRHHEPTEDQKKLWAMIIQEAANNYKVKVDLRWYKPKKLLDIEERQNQYIMHKSVKQKWGFEILQKMLDFRDQVKYDQITNSNPIGSLGLQSVINYFKYALGVKINIARWSSYIQDYEIFNILDSMRTLLDINFGDILNLAPDQIITLSQLHFSLMYYNTKVQYAKGNQVYMMIVHKIVIPWFQNHNKKLCQQFKKQFPKFFSNYIWQDYYVIVGDSLIKFLSEEKDEQSIEYKVSYYMKNLNYEALKSNQLQNNAQLLQKIYSIIDFNTPVPVILTTMQLILTFMRILPQLEDQYISLGFFIDFLDSHSKIDEYMKKIQDFDYNQKVRLNFQLIKKLPEKITDFSTNQIIKILQIEIQAQNQDLARLLTILDQIPQNKNNLPVTCIKALVAQKYLQKSVQNLKDKPQQKKQLQMKFFKYWKQLQNYVKINSVERKKQEQQVNLARICQIFQQTVFKKLKQDYRKILHIENKKKKSSKKKSSQAEKSSMSENEKKQEQNKSKEIQFGDKYKEAKIWRKVVQNFGTFEDTILFGEDPLELAGSQQQQIYEQCLKIIEQKTIQQKYLKRIIRKLPILQKCAQQAVKKLTSEQNKQTQHIQPQFLCKLIMINSRYRSKIVESFILQNISKIPIPVKIYQDYLILDIKKKLQSSPKDIIHKMLYEQLTIQDMRKIDQIFNQLVYMPIKKFENIYLKFQDKIQQNQQQQNQEWQTQSQGKNKQQEQQQTKYQKKKEKKNNQGPKSQNQQAYDDNNHLNQIESDFRQSLIDSDDNEDDDEDIDDQGDNQYGQNSDDMGQQKPKIIDMFYLQNDSNLPKYKQFIHLRQQINLALQSNYLSLEHIQNKIKSDPELQKKIFRLVDILENEISQKQIVIQILNKTPTNLYTVLRNHGLTIERNEQKVQQYRKEVTKMPRFINDNLSQQDDNSENNDDEDNYDEEGYDNDDDLSEQSGSEDNMFDGLGDQMLFAINEQGQLQQINNQGLNKAQQIQSDDLQQNEIEQNEMMINLQKQADDTLTLPQLKQINSKIELQLTGKQLSAEDIVRIMEIAIVKLFSLHTYQLKQRPVTSFYSQIMNSKHGKIFIDTVFTVLRVDELYNDQQRFNLAKKLRNAQLSLSKALNNFLQISIDIATEQSKEGDQFGVDIRDEVRALLPIGEQVVLKSDIPVQDHYLTLLIFYSRYRQQNIHEKTKRLLSTLYQDKRKQYELTKAKASILTKHIYLNNNSSSIWNNMQQRFGVKISKKIKFSSCLAVYGQLLRKDVEKCYNDLLEIVKIPIEVHNEEEKKQAKMLIKQQQKKVEQNLKKHFKRIKHYYYWNKRNIFQQLNEDDNKPTQLLKNKDLIKLTQLMIFYCHFLKQRFFEKIDGSSMKNLLVLPKSVIEVSFMFLWNLEAKIDKWEPLSKVKQYFKAYKLYQHKFNRLQQVCNLVLEFLQMPQFSNSKFKEVIIPYFINNPQMAHDIPLIFKLPDIPEQLNGQKVYLTRQCSFDMSFYQLVSKSISVEFHNQEGSDHGGMVRQFMMGWSGVGIGQQAIFLGKILAISFKKSIPFGGQFDIGMAVAITQHKVTIQFLANVDPEISQSLKYIRDNDPQDLDMKFQITKQQYGVIKHYPLIPNGSQVSVTNDNKKQYIDLFLSKYFLVGRQWQISELCTGFFSIVNKKYASIFSPFEMIQKIQGQQIQDYTKLKNKTKYEQGYTQSSQMIKWFWQIVASFNQKQMNKFLQFITGAPKVSIYNHNFSFVIEKPYGQNQNRLPVAHTCFNTLQLPEYKTKQILEKKLTQAIYEGNDNFGIL